MARKKHTKRPQPTTQQQLDARETALKETLAEMVDVIDNYMLIAPMAFMEGRDASPAQHILRDEYDPGRFNKFSAWMERWMGVLYPNTLECQKKIHDFASQVNALKADVDTVYMDLVYDAQRFGFFLGYLVGIRSMGASRDDVLRKALAFATNDTGHLRWKLQSEQKKRGSTVAKKGN
jgi:hypothetical protein